MATGMKQPFDVWRLKFGVWRLVRSRRDGSENSLRRCAGPNFKRQTRVTPSARLNAAHPSRIRLVSSRWQHVAVYLLKTRRQLRVRENFFARHQDREPALRPGAEIRHLVAARLHPLAKERAQDRIDPRRTGLGVSGVQRDRKLWTLKKIEDGGGWDVRGIPDSPQT